MGNWDTEDKKSLQNVVDTAGLVLCCIKDQYSGRKAPEQP